MSVVKALWVRRKTHTSSRTRCPHFPYRARTDWLVIRVTLYRKVSQCLATVKYRVHMIGLANKRQRIISGRGARRRNAGVGTQKTARSRARAYLCRKLKRDAACALHIPGRLYTLEHNVEASSNNTYRYNTGLNHRNFTVARVIDTLRFR